nr:MAG TPA: hypothetical protein [Caudoviricetes sp.]
MRVVHFRYKPFQFFSFLHVLSPRYIFINVCLIT